LPLPEGRNGLSSVRHFHDVQQSSRPKEAAGILFGDRAMTAVIVRYGAGLRAMSLFREALTTSGVSCGAKSLMKSNTNLRK